MQKKKSTDQYWQKTFSFDLSLPEMSSKSKKGKFFLSWNMTVAAAAATAGGNGELI